MPLREAALEVAGGSAPRSPPGLRAVKRVPGAITGVPPACVCVVGEEYV